MPDSHDSRDTDGARLRNLFEDTARAPDERFLTLAAGGGARVERIVSWGQASPPGFWYDQAQAEWVAVLCGRARLSLRAPDEVREMEAGDTLLIAAGRPHRVDWTDPDQPTVWLAVFLDAPG